MGFGGSFAWALGVRGARSWKRGRWDRVAHTHKTGRAEDGKAGEAQEEGRIRMRGEDEGERVCVGLCVSGWLGVGTGAGADAQVY